MQAGLLHLKSPPDPLSCPVANRMNQPTLSQKPPRPFWTAFGPGLLFAGAAVGVSHLVQSTRAGASYGLAMLAIVLLANIVKFPAFRFGPHYAAATGHSLLDGYRRQGRWTLVVFSLLTLGTMFTITSVVTLVTAGVAIAVFGLEDSLSAIVAPQNAALAVSGVLIGASAILLSIGGYKWLDRFMKLVMPLLTLSTLAATALALGRIDWSFPALLPTGLFDDPKAILFMVALIGWMPSAIDISVWSSLWTVARAKQQHASGNLRATLADFDAGYLATLLLALAFVLMGTGLMFGRGIPFDNNAAKFATQVIDLYATTLGEWCRPLVGGTAFLVMLSTTVTVIDAFPRVLAALLDQLRTAFSRTNPAVSVAGEGGCLAYRASFAILTAGSLGILAWGMSSFTALVDLATTISFVTAPVLSFFNHRAVFGRDIPAPMRPSQTMRLWSLAGILLQSAFALYFFWIKFARPL